MCLICVEFNKGKLSIREAYTNLTEVYSEEDEHTKDVWRMLVEAELDSKGNK